MKTDDFEKRLQRQTPRKIPASWREEILNNANSIHRPSPTASRLSWVSVLIHQLSTFLRPQRAAWAGLAVVWVVIFALNFSVRDGSTSVLARNLNPPSPEMLLALRQQQLLLAELVERPEPRIADRPKIVPPRPRSDRHLGVLAA